MHGLCRNAWNASLYLHSGTEDFHIGAVLYFWWHGAWDRDCEAWLSVLLWAAFHGTDSLVYAL